MRSWRMPATAIPFWKRNATGLADESMRRKRSRSKRIARTAVAVRSVAVRGEPSTSAICPTTEPRPRVASRRSPKGEAFRTWTSPSMITKQASPGWPSSASTVPSGQRRTGATLASRSTSVAVKPGSADDWRPGVRPLTGWPPPLTWTRLRGSGVPRRARYPSMRWLVCRSRSLTRSISAPTNDTATDGAARSSELSRVRSSWASRQSSSATTVAEQGAGSTQLISPTTAPGLSTCSLPGRSVPAAAQTDRRPSINTYRESPCCPWCSSVLPRAKVQSRRVAQSCAKSSADRRASRGVCRSRTCSCSQKAMVPSEVYSGDARPSWPGVVSGRVSHVRGLGELPSGRRTGRKSRGGGGSAAGRR